MTKTNVDLTKRQLKIGAFISGINNYLKKKKIIPKLRLLLDLLVKAVTIYKALKS